MDLSFGRFVTLAVLGFIALGVMFLHPVGPLVVLAFITPFDGIFFQLFHFVGNMVTLVPIIVFFARTPASLWGQALLGTRIQVVLFAWVLLLFISHIVALPIFGEMVFLSYARKVTYVLVLMLFAWYWRDHRYVATTIKLFVISMAGYTALAMLDFYGGIQIMPVSVKTFEEGALGVEYQPYLTGQLRFTAPGLSVNRYGGYLIIMSFLSVGWFSWAKGGAEKALALAITGLLVVALLCTVSRSAVLGLLVGGLLLGPLAFRLGVREVLIGTAAVVVLGTLVVVAASYLGNIFDTLERRFEGDYLAYSTSGRLLRWTTGFRVWAGSPLWGVGDDLFVRYSAQLLAHQPGGKGSHNAYVKLLAETGLIGMVPFIYLFVLITRSYLTSVAKYSPTHDFWRPYFFVGFVGVSVQNIFNDYAFERIYWTTWAYAVVLEWVGARGRAEERARLAKETAYGALGETTIGPLGGVDPPPSAPSGPEPSRGYS